MSALPDQLPSARNAAAGTGGTGGTRDPVKPTFQVAGGLGIAAVLLGLAILIASCAGFDAALYFSPAVILLGSANLILMLIATRQSNGAQDSSTLASLFLATLAILGGLFELAVLLHWPVLFSQFS